MNKSAFGACLGLLLMAHAHADTFVLTMQGTIAGTSVPGYSDTEDPAHAARLADAAVMATYQPGQAFSATWTVDVDGMHVPYPYARDDQFWGGDITLNMSIPDAGTSYSHTWQADLSSPNTFNLQAGLTIGTVYDASHPGAPTPWASSVNIAGALKQTSSQEGWPFVYAGASVSTTKPFTGSLLDMLQNIDPKAVAAPLDPGYHLAGMSLGVADSTCWNPVDPSSHYCGLVQLNVTAVSSSLVPEPANWSLMSLGLLSLLVSMKAASRRRP